MKFLWLVSTVAILVAIIPNLTSAKAPPGSKGLSHRRTRCGYSRLASHGFVSSPNYPRHYDNNVSCAWLVMVPLGKIIEVKFLDFDLENHTRCAYDYLMLRNGPSLFSPLMGKFCGSKKPPTMLTADRHLYIRFKTDHSVRKRGFVVWWRAVPQSVGLCPITPVQRRLGLTGIITTPHYPNNYGNNQFCAWTLSAPAGKIIKLTIVDFKLEYSHRCVWDHVVVRSGLTPFSPLIGRYCGDRRPWIVYSRGRTMRITFKSDGSVTKKGMKAVFRSVHQYAYGG